MRRVATMAAGNYLHRLAEETLSGRYTVETYGTAQAFRSEAEMRESITGYPPFDGVPWTDQDLFEMGLRSLQKDTTFLHAAALMEAMDLTRDEKQYAKLERYWQRLYTGK